MAELSSQATSIQTIYAMFSEEKLFVNRRYQRKLVWTLAEKQKLIESIQKKYLILAILIAEREDHPSTYEIIDGLQRLHAIISFIETAFPTSDGKRFSIEYFPTAKRIADEGGFLPSNTGDMLSQREVGDMLNYNLAISYMRGATEEDVNDVFDRINTYGHRLSDQERRQAGVQNEFSNMIRQIACTLRGDESADVLSLRKMPSISIDLPMTKHGYDVQADQVFWVEHGILRATDLRDSMDEQCIADIAACVVGGTLIDRDIVKGLIKSSFIQAKIKPKIYCNHSTADIDSAIRRSEIELSDYELKQGLLTLSDTRSIDNNLLEKILRTICAIANNGPGRHGRVIIGVTDKASDAARIKILDGVEPRAVGKRKVVGVEREAKYLKITMEEYLAKWKDSIKTSKLTASVRDSVMSSIDYNSYFGLGIIVIGIPAQKDLCYYDDKVYWRNGDSTEIADTPPKIVSIANRSK